MTQFGLHLLDDIRRHHLGTVRTDWAAGVPKPITRKFFPAAAQLLGDVEISYVAGVLPQLFELPPGFLRLLERLLTNPDFLVFCIDQHYPLCLALASRIGDRPLLEGHQADWDRLGMFLGLSWNFHHDNDAAIFKAQLAHESQATTEAIIERVFRQPEVLVHILARPPEARSHTHAVIHGAVSCLHFVQALAVFIRASSGPLASAAWNYHAHWILPAAPLLLTAMQVTSSWQHDHPMPEPKRIGFPEPPLTPTRMGSPEPPLTPHFIADSVSFVCRDALDKYQIASPSVEFKALYEIGNNVLSVLKQMKQDQADVEKTANDETTEKQKGQTATSARVKSTEKKPTKRARRASRPHEPSQRKRPMKRRANKRKQQRG